MNKKDFHKKLLEFSTSLNAYVADSDWQWRIKWFVDSLLNVYTISSDTKILSKVLEIHLFPLFLEFANENWLELVPAEKQNWYPDISFVSKADSSIRYAVDLKTTYRAKESKCNWFTLWSHWQYFRERTSTKNIQFPYWSYQWHYCLWIIYDKLDITIDETKRYTIEDIPTIKSVISNFTFFAQEKRKIASDSWWSGNTANIWSIKDIKKIIDWDWVFALLWEEVFDDYWINQWVLMVPDPKKPWEVKKLTKLEEFMTYKNQDFSLINKPEHQWK